MSNDKTPARSVFTGNRLIDEAQKNGRDAVNRQNRAIFSGGVLLDTEDGAVAGAGLSFSSGVARSIRHGLGRKARGFIEVYGVDIPSAANVGLFASAHPAPLTSDTHVTVTPTNTGTCCLFVY